MFSPVLTVLLCEFLQHVVIGLRLLITLAVPQVPAAVKRRVDSENRRLSKQSNHSSRDVLKLSL